MCLTLVDGTSRMECDGDDARDSGVAVEMIPLTVISDVQKDRVPVEGFVVEMSNVLRARRILYVSHFFAQFSEVAWQFFNTLCLAAITDYQSLILVSTYGIATGLAVCIAGPTAGRFIDTSNRLLVAQRLIWLENIAVVLATVFYFVLLANESDTMGNPENAELVPTDLSWLSYRLQGVPTDFLSVLLLLGIHALGAAAQVLDKAFVVAIERDWVVVMSQAAADSLGTDQESDAAASTFSSWLSETNISMRQIDLGCKVAAPSVAGFMIPLFVGRGSSPTGSNLRWACLFIGALNVAALVVEYVCTKQIYMMLPSLAFKSPTQGGGNEDDSAKAGDEVSSTSEFNIETPSCEKCRLPRGLRIYMDQKISWAGIALAMLYLNALSFGNGIMTAYLLYRDMKVELVGVCRGVASVISLLGTVLYYVSAKRMSLEGTGMWSILFECGCLSLCFGSLYVDQHTWSLGMLITGVCLSRIGLWVFDIAVTQLQQERIPADVRGVVGGVQQSLNAFFGLLCFTLGVFFPSTSDFQVYVSTAFGSVSVAACFYAIGVYYPKRNS